MAPAFLPFLQETSYLDHFSKRSALWQPRTRNPSSRTWHQSGVSTVASFKNDYLLESLGSLCLKKLIMQVIRSQRVRLSLSGMESRNCTFSKHSSDPAMRGPQVTLWEILVSYWVQSSSRNSWQYLAIPGKVHISSHPGICLLLIISLAWTSTMLFFPQADFPSADLLTHSFR